MKSFLSTRLLALAAGLTPALVHAHPGHDGDHELVWDFTHLASHPLATVAYLAILAAAIWGVRRALKSRAHDQTADRSSRAGKR